MYKPKISLVNGEIIRDLLDLCNDEFINPFIQPYAGSNHECMYCGAMRGSKDEAHHSTDCPVTKYTELIQKHKKWIVKKRDK